MNNDLFNKDSDNHDNNDDFYATFQNNEVDDNFYNNSNNDNISDDFYHQINENNSDKIENNDIGDVNNSSPELQNKFQKISKRFKFIFIFLIMVVLTIVSTLVLAELKIIKLPWLNYPEVLNLSQNEVMLKKDSGFQFSSNVYPSQVFYGKIIYESSNPTVAEVNSTTGYVLAKSNGTATIKAYLEEYTDVVDTCEVVVSDNNVLIESMSVEHDNVDLLKNSKYILKYSYYPKNAGMHYFTYSTSDQSILNVSNSGEVTAIKPGMAVITITDDVSGQSVNQEFTVYDSKDFKIDNDNHIVSDIKVSTNNVNLVVGGQIKVTAEVYPKGIFQNIVWTSVNDNIATVSNDGLITAIDYGETKIIATAIDGTNKVINVNVQEDEVKVTGFNITDKDISLERNSTAKINYEITPSKATNQKIEWSSSDERIVKIDNNGNAFGMSLGSAVITAVTDDGEFTSQVSVNVYEPKVEVNETDLTLSKTSVTLDAGQTENIIAEVIPNNASNKSLTWSSNNEAVATVKNGMIYAKSQGNAIITVKTNNRGISKNISVIVKDIRINSISLSETSIKAGIGAEKQIYVTYSPSNASNKKVTWTSSNYSVASVNENGLIITHKVGKAIIIASTVNGKAAKCNVTVTNERIEPQTITLNKENFVVKVNENISITPIITPSNVTNSSVTWTSDNTSVAKVLSDGKISGVREGVALITAKTINGKTASAYIVVKNSNPPVHYLDGTTIKYWVDKSFKTYAVTHIWVKDAYNQFKVEIPSKFGTLANPYTLMQRASKNNSGKTLIGVNASGFVTSGFSADLYRANKKWGNTSVSPIVIYEGKVLRDFTTMDLPDNRHKIFGMNKNGQLDYYTFSRKKEENKGLADKLLKEGFKYTFGWAPVLVYDGNVLSGLATDANIRQGVCQQDEHNFLYITNITSNRGKGFSPKKLGDKMKELGCVRGFNLDGGGSTSLYYVKKGASKPTKISAIEGTYGRSIADILYFVGD